MLTQEQEDIVAQSRALARPNLELADRAFYDTLQRLRYQQPPLKEWELSQAVERAAGEYVASKVETTAHAIRKVVESRHVALTREQIEEIFATMRPTIDDIRGFAYKQANGFGFGAGPGFGIAMDNAFRLTTEIETETLALLASRPSLSGSHNTTTNKTFTEKQPDFTLISADTDFSDYLAQLWTEAMLCYSAGANIATIILLGSVLEGTLLAKIHSLPKQDSGSQSGQRAASSHPRSNATLSELIDVASARGWIHQTRYRFSDVLRNYRNFVHPERAYKAGHSLDRGAATICLQVVREVLRDLGILDAR